MSPKSPAHVALGAAVRELRVRAGMSQEDLAHESALDRTYISGIERGVRNIGYTNLLAVAAALRVPASQLVARAERLSDA